MSKVSVMFFRNERTTKKTIMLGDQITPEVEYIFGNGQCHALALELHKILEWPLYGEYNRWCGDRSTRHYVVQSPSGLMGDIHGIRCLDAGYRKTNPTAVKNSVRRGFLPLCTELAVHYAPKIAEELWKQAEAIRTGKPKPKWTICSEGYSK